MAGGYDSDAEGAANGAAGMGGSFGEKAVSKYFFLNNFFYIIFQYKTK